MEKGDKGNIQVSRTRRHQDVTNLSGPWDNEWWRVYWTHGRITTAKQILNLKDNRRIRRKLAYSNLVQQHTHTQTQTKRQLTSQVTYVTMVPPSGERDTASPRGRYGERPQRDSV